MPLEKLTRDELSSLRGGGGGAGPVVAEYASFLSGRPIGTGGRATVAGEGVTRVQIKNRLKKAAVMTNVHLKFLHSSDDEVVFEVVDAANAPKPRGRKPKSAA